MFIFPSSALGFTTGQNANLVIGQPDFATGGTIHGNPSGNDLYIPEGIALDNSGNLWVADTGFNRVLMFPQPFMNDERAKIVIGQKNLTSTMPALSPTGLDQPYGLAFDKGGNMWIADTNNNRIVEYKAPLTTGEAASLVIGSPSYDKGVYPTSANSLAAPYGLAFDGAGDLWAVDYYDDRVLEYVPPFKDGMNATLVIGQPDFTTNSDGMTQNRLNLPSAIAFDSAGNLWVTDSLNNRVLEFTTPFTTDESASIVIGQQNFTENNPGIANDSLNTPYGITIDRQGDLWITDGNNARVLEYVPPLSDGMSASIVLGQQNFEGMHTGTSANTLSEPYDVKLDNKGNIWVADTDNNRVLEFSNTSLQSSSTTVPEFGPVVLTVLALSIGITAVVSRTRLFRV